MNRTARMLLMSGGKDKQRDHDGRSRGSREHDYERIGYEPENRFRDRRGREHYNDGQYAPMGHYDGGYSSGYWPSTPYVPPMMGHYEERRGQYTETPYRPMNKIGFALSGEMDKVPPEFRYGYSTDATPRSVDETTHRTSGQYSGRIDASGPIPFTREDAMSWTSDMVNSDGSKGPHWSMEQVKQVMEQRGIRCDPIQFYAVLNAVYSDYYAVAQKYGLQNKMDFYVDLAKAWLEDDDAVEDKAGKYFAYIVKH